MSEKMREEFEAWASSYRDHNGLPHFTMRRPDGKYVDGTTELCWRGWQASRESLVIELPSDDYLMKSHLGHPYDVRDECKEFIEKAGLKVKP